MRADHAPTEEASIDGLLRRLDETVTIHQKWNQLVADVGERLDVELATNTEQSRADARVLEWVLREMGEWD